MSIHWQVSMYLLSIIYSLEENNNNKKLRGIHRLEKGVTKDIWVLNNEPQISNGLQ